MNYITSTRLRLSSRNEGKIKAYDSCSDVRAWSHDVEARDRYLREWMKEDMTVCFTPVSALAKLLKIMTYKNRGNTPPRCHPDCKSKVILESICNSCDAMKNCLKSNNAFQKYFDEEEFETSHWPCERCMEAMKSIKMFWKIIVEKLFKLNLLKNDDLKDEECTRCDSLRSVAKQWQDDIMQQAIYVKSFKPIWNTESFIRNTCIAKCPVNAREPEEIAEREYKKTDNSIISKTTSYTIKSVKATDTSSLSSSVVRKSRRRLVSCSRQSRRMVDKYCETCNIESENKELSTYKTNLLNLQKKDADQQNIIDKLRADNNTLKMELQNLNKQLSCKSSLYTSKALRKNKDIVAPIPKPFETNTEEGSEPAKDIDSEMVITMKKCKNQSYRHISMLQVLHKSNGPIRNDTNLIGSRCQQEDPINVLTRVHETFGQIVKREMRIVNEEGTHHSNKMDIDATFHRMNTSRSAPSCSTMSTSSSDFFVRFSGDKKSF